MRIDLLKKALIMSAFFVSVILQDGIAVAAECGQPMVRRSVDVTYVYDGDTLKLSNRRKLRLVGVNTPEVKDSRPEFADIATKATHFVRQWIKKQDRLYLEVAQDEKDNYGRTLGYLVSASGEDLGHALVANGLAFAVTIAPNDEKQRCYAEAESLARSAYKGIWLSDPSIKAGDVRYAGFALVTGKITHVLYFKTSTAYVLDNSIVVMLKLKPRLSLQIGQHLEVRGWVSKKSFHYKDFMASYVLHLNNLVNIKVL